MLSEVTGILVHKHLSELPDELILSVLRVILASSAAVFIWLQSAAHSQTVKVFNALRHVIQMRPFAF